MSETTEFWAGSFGSEYTARNRVDWRARIPFWQMILDKTGARSVYEVGCNAGWNLSAIKRAYPDVALYGHDVNEAAATQALWAGLDVTDGETPWFGNQFDLVFTAGVLIHVAPSDLLGMMKSIVDVSADYVLAVEYAADKEQEVEYRGHSGRLWKRPYGELYQGMGLTLVETGDAGPAFDRCTFWLLKR